MTAQQGRRHAPFFYVTPAALAAGAFTLGGDDARHLALVRRAAVGDLIVACDGQGVVADAQLVAVTAKAVEASVLSRSFSAAPRPVVEVYQALAKGDKVDSALRQLVELGVDRVVLFVAGRSVARWDAAREKAAVSRWEGLALQAARQSHRHWLPRVAGPLTLTAAAADAAGGAGLGLVAQPGAARSLAKVIDAPCSELPARVWVVVGPEGGLESEEVAAFEAAGGCPVTLGDQILRTETAAPAITAAVMYRFGRLGQ